MFNSSSGTLNFDVHLVPRDHHYSDNESDELELTDTAFVKYAFSPLELKLMGIWAIIVLVCGLVVNTLTIVALLRPANPRIINPTRDFIISLTCANLTFCLGVLPFQVLNFLFHVSFEEGIMCNVLPLVRYLTSAALLMNLMLIAVNRYINIAQSGIYFRVYQDHWITLMIACSWLISFLVLLPTLLGVWGKFAYDPRLGACSIVRDHNGVSSKLALFITAFVVPLVIIIACYTCILFTTYRWNKHARKRGLLTQRKERNQEQRVTIMAVALTVAYIVCYSPLTLAKLLDKSTQKPLFHVIGYCLWYAEAILNPTLYVLLNYQYRKELSRVASRLLFCVVARWRGRINIAQDSSQQGGVDATPNISQVIQAGIEPNNKNRNPAWV